MGLGFRHHRVFARAGLLEWNGTSVLVDAVDTLTLRVSKAHTAAQQKTRYVVARTGTNSSSFSRACLLGAHKLVKYLRKTVRKKGRTSEANQGLMVMKALLEYPHKFVSARNTRIQ